jgi:hypothetical protein
MGTPHQGDSGVALGKLMVNIASAVMPADDRLLKNLERDSEWLQMQLGQYGPIGADFVTKFAFEEVQTPTLLGHSNMVSLFICLAETGSVDKCAMLYPERQQLCPALLTRSRLQHMQVMSTWSDSPQATTVDIKQCRGICELWHKVQVRLYSRGGRLKVGWKRVCSPRARARIVKFSNENDPTYSRS